MYNYKLTIQYDGGRYKGWQKLGKKPLSGETESGFENTIQGKLENVISQLAGEETEVIGCGRTDAGVHAIAQTANFKMNKELSADAVMDYLNHYLPEDISITEVTAVPESFHARYNAKSKTYLYKIWNREYTNPFMRKFSMHVEKSLNIEKMKKAGCVFIGEHDFTAFTNAKSKTKSMVRNIDSIDFEEADGFINIRIRGDGFLYNMVRRIVGILIQAGLNETDINEIPDILNSRDRSRTGRMAEAYGLYLESIEY